ncbi:MULTISPECIES: MarR family winged helix-turn-helix transcriptional regulator [Streptosporangium]|uniref:DNA-binding MarR family transcriptional regulator n=1 Tax=Streptosporangium brasiliense TaxID=47480 RepID=A0ABT9REQ7_9ACTN|nr:MarR family winged helix-turn-helix transcriptional regulator [Streptosporangium brasiliense]MDP9867199.1 DNA-binding MarR family transcriptional regulator [Streptosporangium brasiliense]
MNESAESWYEAHARDRVADMRTPADSRAFTLSYNVLQLSQMLVNDLESRVHRPRGLTLPGFRLMFKLWLLGPTQSARLAEMSVLTRSAVSNLVNTLEREGLVERSRTVADRRLVYVDLTEKGRAMVTEAFELQTRRERSWFTALDETEQARFVAMMRKLIESRPQD